MRILLTKPDALGDQVMIAGLVQSLLRRRPDLRLVWHVKSGSEAIAALLGAPVFTINPTEDPAAEARRLAAAPDPLLVLPYPLHPHETWSADVRRRLDAWVAFLQAAPWDAIVCPVVNRTWITDVTVSVARAPMKLGFADTAARQPPTNEAHALVPAEGPPFTQRLEGSFTRSEFEQHRDLLSLLEPGLRDDEGRAAWRLGRGSGEVSDRVLLAPGVGGDPDRAWPGDRFAALAAALRQRGLPLGWIEGPGDESFVAQAAPEPGDLRLRFGRADLPALAATLAAARLVVCHDTSYAHLAASLGVPTVALFGAGQEARFHPRGANVTVVQAELPCAGCQWYCLFDRKVCVTDLPVEGVLSAVGARLGAGGAAGVHPVPIATPLAGAAEGEQVAIRRRLQERVVFLEADRFARLQIIHGLLDRPSPPAPRSATSPDSPAPSPGPPDRAGRISVVIPMGRPERAAGTLNSLAAQKPTPADWEIVVAGVGADAVVTAHPTLPIVPVPLATRLPPGETRCRGVERATGNWLLFVDDDVELAPDFVARFRQLLDSEPFREAAGRAPVAAVGPRLPGRSRRFFGRLTDVSNFWAQQTRVAEDRTWLFSATLLVRSDAYRRCGGFNPALVIGEDVDLTTRLTAHGFRLRYEPSLVAWHDHRRDTLPRMWRYFWQNGTAPEFFFAHFQVACCFSIKTVFLRAWRDLRMNLDFMRRNGERLGWLAPWVYANYLILELSWEYHYQRLLRHERRYTARSAPAASDRTYVRAMGSFERGRRLEGTARYLLAMVQDFGNPVRR